MGDGRAYFAVSTSVEEAQLSVAEMDNIEPWMVLPVPADGERKMGAAGSDAEKTMQGRAGDLPQTGWIDLAHCAGSGDLFERAFGIAHSGRLLSGQVGKEVN